MRAIVKKLHSPDVRDLSAYQPENPEDFGFLLQIMAGPENQKGEESFDVIVCTPKWMERYYKDDRGEAVVIGRHHLIVFEYDYVRLVKKINSFVESCSGCTWSEIACKVSRL